MTTLITGDIHYSADPRNTYRFLFTDWLCRAIKKHGVNDLIILGDITDIKDEHSAEFVNEVVSHLHRLSKLCNITIPTGNHDYVSNTCPFFQFVNFIPNITWVNKITNMHFDDIGDCLFLPHTKDWARDWPTHLKKKRDCVFTHCTFEGSAGDFGKGIPLGMFKNQPLVVSGDVHPPHAFKNIVYAGAPYTINFGDDYVGRVILFDRDATPWYSIHVNMPQKRLVIANYIEELDKFTGLFEGDIVKVEFNLRRKDQERWYDIKSEVKKWGDKHGYAIDAVVPVIDIQTTPYKKIDLETDEQLITAYAKSVGAPGKTLERGLYLADKAAE